MINKSADNDSVMDTGDMFKKDVLNCTILSGKEYSVLKTIYVSLFREKSLKWMPICC